MTLGTLSKVSDQSWPRKGSTSPLFNMTCNSGNPIAASRTLSGESSLGDPIINANRPGCNAMFASRLAVMANKTKGSVFVVIPPRIAVQISSCPDASNGPPILTSSPEVATFKEFQFCCRCSCCQSCRSNRMARPKSLLKRCCSRHLLQSAFAKFGAKTRHNYMKRTGLGIASSQLAFFRAKRRTTS